MVHKSKDQISLLQLLDYGIYIQFDLLGRVGAHLMMEPSDLSNPWPSYLDISSTDDLINIIKTLKKNIIINSHPQRWNDGFFAWSAELILQNMKNLGKRFVLKKRKLS